MLSFYLSSISIFCFYLLTKGNAITSFIVFDPVRNIIILSIPIPKPPVGGIAVSIAIANSSSIGLAVSRPPLSFSAWSCNNIRCLNGSFNSE